MKHRDLLKKVVRTAEERKKDWGSGDSLRVKLRRLVTELGYGVPADERELVLDMARVLIMKRLMKPHLKGSGTWPKPAPNISLPAVRSEVRRLNREIPRHYTDEREDRNDEIHLDQAS